MSKWQMYLTGDQPSLSPYLSLQVINDPLSDRFLRRPGKRAEESEPLLRKLGMIRPLLSQQLRVSSCAINNPNQNHHPTWRCPIHPSHPLINTMTLCSNIHQNGVFSPEKCGFRPIIKENCLVFIETGANTSDRRYRRGRS